MVQLLQMWALVEVLGLVCLPLTTTIFKNLPDRGWAFTKIVGLALLAFCVWLPLMTLQFLPFSRTFVLGVLLLIVALNLLSLPRTWKSIVTLVRTHLVYVIVCELVYLGMMFLLGWVRSYNPNIQSFEMFMDEGFLAAILRSPHFPPQDMWLSGYSINYYYYAHYTIAVLAKLINQPASIAFNTGICTFFGLTAINIFGVTSNIVAWASHQRASDDGRRPRRQVPSLVKAMPFGAISVLMGLLLGNLASTQVWWQQHDSGLPYFYWFDVSRVVPKTINEFPAFSFLLSCFHAHVLTLAFTILAVGLIFNLFLERGDTSDEDAQGLHVFGRSWRLFLNLGFTAVTLGGLFVMNGWDFPTYLGLALICIALQQWMAYGSRFSFELVLDVFTSCASLTALSFFLYAPFYLNFISPSQGIGIVDPANRSNVSDEMLIYGTFMFIFVTFLFVNLVRNRMSPDRSVAGLVSRPAQTDTMPLPAVTPRGSMLVNSQQAQPYLETEPPAEPSSPPVTEMATQPVEAVSASAPGKLSTPLPSSLPAWLTFRTVSQVLIILAALLIFLLVKNSLWLVIAFIITAMAAELILFHLHDRPRAFTLLLGGVAFGLVAITEVVFLRDVFVASFPRMNTVFKFYFQAWALLSITSGASFYFIFESFRPVFKLDGLQLWVRRSGQMLWAAICLLLLLAGAIYPVAGSYQRTNDYAQRSNSLDGMAYLQQYSPGDYYAIQWLNANISGDPVIVEAYSPQGGDYSDFDRISAFTGLPTLMGWVGHEYQWRVNWLNDSNNAADFYSRGTAINDIYMSKDPRTVLSTMARYQAEYLYVGNLEISTYSGYNLQRFGKFMTIVYSFDGVTIYKVPS